MPFSPLWHMILILLNCSASFRLVRKLFINSPFSENIWSLSGSLLMFSSSSFSSSPVCHNLAIPFRAVCYCLAPFDWFAPLSQASRSGKMSSPSLEWLALVCPLSRPFQLVCFSFSSSPVCQILASSLSAVCNCFFDWFAAKS